MSDEGNSPDDNAESQDDAQPAKPEPAKDDAGYFRGERGRTVPRAAWIILAIALVLLLVFVIVRPKWFTRDYDDTSLDVPADRHYTKTLAGAGHNDGVWLTDDSPSTTFAVTFPADSTREETRLHLTGTTQVAQDSTVFLSVRMDGQQVYKDELSSGSNDLDTFIDVPEELSSDGQVRVQVSVDGTLENGECTPDQGAGMQVYLDPASVVEAALSERVHTVRDAVVSWDRDVTVVLADQSDEWRTTAAQLGIALTREGHHVTFADEVPGTNTDNAIMVGPEEALTNLGWSASEDTDAGVVVGTAKDDPVVGVVTPDGSLISSFLTNPTVGTADSDVNTPQAVSTPVVDGNDVGLGALGTDTSVVQISEIHNWRVRYSLADLPGGRLPQSVRVALVLPDTPDDLTWILNVQLNGQLIESRRLSQSAATATIALPPSAQLLENNLTLSVQRDRDLGGCDVRITTYPMQLTESSALILGNDPGTGFTAVPRSLAPGFTVYWPDSENGNAIDQLNATVAVLTEFTPAQYEPEFAWNSQPEPGRPFVLVGQSPEVNPLVLIEDGRIVATPANKSLNISSFNDGMVVEPATSTSGSGGLVIQYVGNPGTLALPAFGTEAAQVVTAQGSFVVAADGTVVPDELGRGNAPG